MSRYNRSERSQSTKKDRAYRQNQNIFDHPTLDDETTTDFDESHDSDVDPKETAQAKKRRIAKSYLKSLEDDTNLSDSSAEIDPSSLDEHISMKLQKNRKNIPENVYSYDDMTSEENFLSGKSYYSSKKPLTCVALSSDESFVMAGSKDGSIIRWDVDTGAKSYLGSAVDRLLSEVFAVYIHNNNFIVSGGKDRILRVFDTRSNTIAHKLEGHRDSITGITIRGDELLSVSLDRTIKSWDLRSFSYVDSMFGHQSAILSVDCMTNAVTGSMDRTVRTWNSSDDTHNVYRGSSGSVDCVRAMSNNVFLSGGEDGNLYCWRQNQKKYVSSVRSPHGIDEHGVSNWITSISSVRHSNIFASGSNDGFIRLWKLEDDERRMTSLASIVARGFVNGICMTPKLVVAALGKEHRFGRWSVFPGDCNKLLIAKLK